MEAEIFKIQIPIIAGTGFNDALVYNEDRSILFQMPIDDMLTDLMKGRPKAFFYGSIVDFDDESRLGIEDEAPWQDW